MADQKDFTRIRCLKQGIYPAIGGDEVFEPGEVIDVDTALLPRIRASAWEKVSKTTKTQRLPVKYWVTTPDGREIDHQREKDEYAKTKPTQYEAGRATVSIDKTLADV